MDIEGIHNEFVCKFLNYAVIDELWRHLTQLRRPIDQVNKNPQIEIFWILDPQDLLITKTVLMVRIVGKWKIGRRRRVLRYPDFDRTKYKVIGTLRIQQGTINTELYHQELDGHPRPRSVWMPRRVAATAKWKIQVGEDYRWKKIERRITEQEDF